MHDVLIIGGGPAGLGAALALGRGRVDVLLCDAGPRRNATATHLHNYVTRDGISPDEFRAIARAQLAPYATVAICDDAVQSIDGTLGAFAIRVGERTVNARRVLLCTGMVDELPAMPGYRELWGHAIFQCPYCHGYEVRDRPFGVLAAAPMWLDFAVHLQSWSHDVVVFTGGTFEVPDDARARLDACGVTIEEREVRALVTDGPRKLAAVELADGTRIAREFLFARPPQRLPALVQSLGLALDDHGFVRVDEQRETSRPGLYAAGDVITPMQAAIVAATAGQLAAVMMHHAMGRERAAALLATRQASQRDPAGTSG